MKIARLGKKGKTRKFDSLSLWSVCVAGEGAGEMKSAFKLS